MTWQWGMITYFLISIVLAQGLLYFNSRLGQPTKLSHYLAIIFVGPIAAFIVIVRSALGRRPK